jgi:hypothetical protein
MRTIIGIALPVFALFTGLAMVCIFTATVPDGAPAHVMYAGTPNPTGLPSYEMRPDGLMINGLLPAKRLGGVTLASTAGDLSHLQSAGRVLPSLQQLQAGSARSSASATPIAFPGPRYVVVRQD